MIEIKKIEFNTKQELYEFLDRSIGAILKEESDWLANLCNTTALIWDVMKDINWIGFYLIKDGQLVLGPFQGKPACTRINIGEGVCGTAAERRESIVVEDVHAFPGHIACDNASNSELVVPLIMGNRIVGVLDIDSPELNRFDFEDKAGFEKIAETILKCVIIPERY
ncbi:MAG: guanylate cyclase [Firmicutes bacterium HGW-Firmicutes-18]|nr:MAG: guanylate cyclase [Firmicutes bacterium HGW-Firmicutes-18]